MLAGESNLILLHISELARFLQSKDSRERVRGGGFCSEKCTYHDTSPLTERSAFFQANHAALADAAVVWFLHAVLDSK